MALQSSGAISLSEIQTEFGGSNPIAISEYYSAATGVPASGEIAITDFYGTSAATVAIDNGSLSDARVGTTSSATFRLNTNGTITATGNLTSYSDTNWYEPTTSSIGSDYKVRVTATGDTSSLTGTLNQYTTISSAQSWTLTTSNIQQSVTLSVTVQDVATSTVQDTATITITVDGGV
jgi:hypothetical protein